MPLSRIRPNDQEAMTRAPTMPTAGSSQRAPHSNPAVSAVIASTDVAASAST